MNEETIHSRYIIAVLMTLLVTVACNGFTSSFSKDASIVHTEQIGFGFVNHTINSLEGDHNAPNHLFLHKYPMPGDGFISDVIFLDDSDEMPEIITLLILRPDREGWLIVHNVPIPDDDLSTSTSGIWTLALPSPLPVKKGDIFAHWQPQSRPTGPVPLNVGTYSIDGLSVGRVGFSADDLEIGQVISEVGFTGPRDYAINLLLTPKASN